MNGTDRRELISDSLLHVFGLSLLGDNLYWTDSVSYTHLDVYKRQEHPLSNKYILSCLERPRSCSRFDGTLLG